MITAIEAANSAVVHPQKVKRLRQRLWQAPHRSLNREVAKKVRKTAGGEVELITRQLQLPLAQLGQQMGNGVIGNFIYGDFPLVPNQHLFRNNAFGPHD